MNVFSCVCTCIKTLIRSALVVIPSFLTAIFSCAAVGVACSMGLQGQGRLWWLGRWLMSAVRVTGRFPFLCEKELTASANGWESQNDSSAFSLTRFAYSACFVILVINKKAAYSRLNSCIVCGINLVMFSTTIHRHTS